MVIFEHRHSYDQFIYISSLCATIQFFTLNDFLCVFIKSLLLLKNIFIDVFCTILCTFSHGFLLGAQINSIRFFVIKHVFIPKQNERTD